MGIPDIAKSIAGCFVIKVRLVGSDIVGGSVIVHDVHGFHHVLEDVNFVDSAGILNPPVGKHKFCRRERSEFHFLGTLTGVCRKKCRNQYFLGGWTIAVREAGGRIDDARLIVKPSIWNSGLIQSLCNDTPVGLEVGPSLRILYEGLTQFFEGGSYRDDRHAEVSVERVVVGIPSVGGIVDQEFRGIFCKDPVGS